MEGIKFMGENCSTSYPSSDSDDSDVSIADTELQSILHILPNESPVKLEYVAVTDKQNGSRRHPTRRPNPNVYNRNALLARENRRRKKAYLETVEKELAETRSALTTLKTALKKQLKASRRLEQEKRYYQSIVANRTEIYSLVAALNTRLVPAKAAAPNETRVVSYLHPPSPVEAASVGSYESEPLSVSWADNSDNDYDHTPAFNDSWSQLLEKDDFGFKPTPSQESPSANAGFDTQNICNEHSYVQSLGIANNVGVCLHISSGKVSLEFCPACHKNASRTPPTQLLQSGAVA